MTIDDDTDLDLDLELEMETKRLRKECRDRAKRRASSMTRKQLLAALDREFAQRRKRKLNRQSETTNER